MNIKKVSNTELAIMPHELIKVSEQGHIIELMYMSNPNHKATIRMLHNNKYLVLSTGEIRDCIKHKSRIELQKNLLRTFRNLKAIINTNVVNLDNVRWITLTYRQQNHEPMTDTVKLMKDFEKFNKRFQYYLENYLHYNKAEYIVVAEPQGSGAWHMHLLYIFDKKAPFISNDDVLEPMWSHGFTKIKALKGDITNIGAYLTAYLTDMCLDDIDSVDKLYKICSFYSDDDDDDLSCRIGKLKTVFDSDNIPKSIVKGARLAFYPCGFRIYRTSRGIKKPKEYYSSKSVCDRKYQGKDVLFEKTLFLEDTVTDYQSYINKKYIRV